MAPGYRFDDIRGLAEMMPAWMTTQDCRSQRWARDRVEDAVS